MRKLIEKWRRYYPEEDDDESHGRGVGFDDAADDLEALAPKYEALVEAAKHAKRAIKRHQDFHGEGGVFLGLLYAVDDINAALAALEVDDE